MSFTISQSLFKLLSIESVMPSNHPILCRPLLLLPLIFPSISESETESHSVVSTTCNSMDYTAHGILQVRILEWIAFPFSRGSSQPRSPPLQADSLPAKPQGKPKNTGVGSLSLLQWIFPTQESNRDLLHCRQILYQLSYQGSPSQHQGLFQ